MAPTPRCADTKLTALSSFRVLSEFLTFQGLSKFSALPVLVDWLSYGPFPGCTRSKLAHLHVFVALL